MVPDPRARVRLPLPLPLVLHATTLMSATITTSRFTLILRRYSGRYAFARVTRGDYHFKVTIGESDVSEEKQSGEGGTRTGRILSPQEIDEFLKKGFWGVLATSVSDEPYGVPIIYGYDDDGTFYIANGPGKKIRNMETNPNVTLTVVDVEDYGKRWTSVIVYGKAEILSEIGEKMHAFNTLRKQIPRAAVRVRDASRIAMAKVVRIVPTTMTGKATGY